MWNKYQDEADAQNNRVRRSQNVVVGQQFNPGPPYQAWANTFNNKMINADDPRVPHHPIENMAAGSQEQADGFLNRITASDNLQLRGLGYLRRSGSMARATRHVGGLGDLDNAAEMDIEKSCSSFNLKKWNEPIVAFLLAHPAAGGEGAIKAAATQFGGPEMTCWLAAVFNLGGVEKLATAEELAKLKTAGQKMFDNGWWNQSNWYDRWMYGSGAEPFYKNPYYIGGIGVAAVAAWFIFRKKGR